MKARLKTFSQSIFEAKSGSFSKKYGNLDNGLVLKIQAGINEYFEVEEVESGKTWRIYNIANGGKEHVGELTKDAGGHLILHIDMDIKKFKKWVGL